VEGGNSTLLADPSPTSPMKVEITISPISNRKGCCYTIHPQTYHLETLMTLANIVDKEA